MVLSPRGSSSALSVIHPISQQHPLTFTIPLPLGVTCLLPLPPNSPMSNLASSHHWVVRSLSFNEPSVPHPSPPQLTTLCLTDMQVKTEWPLPQCGCVSSVGVSLRYSCAQGSPMDQVKPISCWDHFYAECFFILLCFLFTFRKYLHPGKSVTKEASFRLYF